ncbi:putative indolepyruvate oxidoreductase subunit B [mine drainage metagenome]|uniref:Putative indolepyruvate oxidoreductase subunit B n=1 Tax=mine drainage metagenome TaxID=410659 RepID=A0A1J5R5L8_9ZZZZ
MSARPFTILVAALGGEGGGMLADWLVDAATHEGFPVQSTSIPGVSQRTGATTYYLEIFPQRASATAGRLPVMALIPSPGGIDLMAASELVEAGRALQNAFVTADRTTLVASTHRIYATSEKMVPIDGRYASEKIISAAPQLSQRAILFDMAPLAQQAGTIINAVLFGAMAGSGVLPLSIDACRAAIRGGGKGTEASLRGFELGYARAAGEAAPAAAPSIAAAPPASERVHKEFPPELHELLDRAVVRLTDYQDAVYAALYLDRVRKILAVDREAQGGIGDFAMTREAARLLSLWMSYEDVIHVAELKTRSSRFERVRSGVQAKDDQPVVITDYLKPGVEEIADILPPGLAGRLRAWEKSRGKTLGFALKLKTSTVAGFLALRLLSLFKPRRRKSSRFLIEQATIERWLGALTRLGMASLDRELVLEIARCARLVRGYGDTQRRGRQVLEKIFAELLENEAAASRGLAPLKQALRATLDAALADPDCAAPAPARAGLKGKPVIWMKAG